MEAGRVSGRCFRVDASASAGGTHAPASDETQSSVTGPASRLLSERTGTLAQAPGPEDLRYPGRAAACFCFATVERRGVGTWCTLTASARAAAGYTRAPGTVA